RLAVIGQVVGDHAVVALVIAIFEHVTPLATVGSGGVLQQHWDVAGAGLLEVDAVLHTVHPDVDIAPDRRIELPVDIIDGPARPIATASTAQDGHQVLQCAIVRADGADEVAFDLKADGQAPEANIVIPRGWHRL